MSIMNDSGFSRFKKIDHFFIGFIPAIVIPFVLVVLISSQKLPGNYTLYEHIVRAFRSYLFAKIAIMALMPNMVFFFFAYKLELWKLNAGLIVATLLFLICVFLNID